MNAPTSLTVANTPDAAERADEPASCSSHHDAQHASEEFAADEPPERAPDGPSSASSLPVRLDLIDEHNLLAPDERELVNGLTLQAINHVAKGGELRIRLIADDEMAQAHLDYCNVEGTTDVITFDMREGAGSDDSILDVDALICVDEAARQADSRSHTRAHEIVLYALHAALHCLGENDTTDQAWQQMHAREDAVLTAMGLGPLFGLNNDVRNEGEASQ